MFDPLPLVIHDEAHLRLILQNPDEAKRHGVNDNIQVVIPGRVPPALRGAIARLKNGSGASQKIRHHVRWEPGFRLSKSLPLLLYHGHKGLPESGTLLVWHQNSMSGDPNAPAEFCHVLDAFRQHEVSATVFAQDIADNALHAWHINQPQEPDKPADPKHGR